MRRLRGPPRSSDVVVTIVLDPLHHRRKADSERCTTTPAGLDPQVATLTLHQSSSHSQTKGIVEARGAPVLAVQHRTTYLATHGRAAIPRTPNRPSAGAITRKRHPLASPPARRLIRKYTNRLDGSAGRTRGQEIGR